MSRIRTRVLSSAAHIRFVLIPAIWLALFAYAGRPIVTAAQAGGLTPPFAWGAILVFSLLPLLPLLARRSDHLIRRTLMHWTGYSTLGLFSLLLVFVFLSDLIRFADLFIRATIPPHALNLTVLGVAAFLSIVGLVQARWPRV